MPLVAGTEVARYQRTLNAIRARRGAQAGIMQNQVSSAAEAAVLCQPHEINLRLDKVITAGAVDIPLADPHFWTVGARSALPICATTGA